MTAFQPDKAADEPSLTAASAYGETSRLQLVTLRALGKLLPQDLASGEVDTPKGPFVMDQTAPKGSAGDKKRRDAIQAYLDSQIAAIRIGLPYLALKSSDGTERQILEARMALLGLIRLSIDSEGDVLSKQVQFPCVAATQR